MHEPERFGQRWDLSFGDFSTRASMDDAVALLEARGGHRQPRWASSAAGTAHDLSVTVVAYLPGIGRMEPTVASGRVPIGPDEVLLGETAARALGVEIGDEIPLTIDFVGSTQSVTVVGFGVAGTALADPHPGRVAYVTPEAFEGAVELAPQVLLVELEPDADVEAATAALEAAYPDTVVGASSVPRSVLLWDQLSYAPVALAVAVLVLAAVALVNALVTSVRRRGRELAVLKAVGARRRQIRGVVAWQATAWALVAVLIGLPVGVVLSASGWEAITTSLGLHSPTAVPVLFVRGRRYCRSSPSQTSWRSSRVGRPRRSPPPPAPHRVTPGTVSRWACTGTRASCSAPTSSVRPTASSACSPAHHGKVRAVAKGVRKTKSRFGARLEPPTHLQLQLYEGRSELAHHRPGRDDRPLPGDPRRPRPPHPGRVDARGGRPARPRGRAEPAAVPDAPRRAAGAGRPQRPARGARLLPEGAGPRGVPARRRPLHRVRPHRRTSSPSTSTAGGTRCADAPRRAPPSAPRRSSLLDDILGGRLGQALNEPPSPATTEVEHLATPVAGAPPRAPLRSSPSSTAADRRLRSISSPPTRRPQRRSATGPGCGTRP